MQINCILKLQEAARVWQGRAGCDQQGSQWEHQVRKEGGLESAVSLQCSGFILVTDSA